ncbi:MAG: TIGR00282 family metallophosphoesterase [Leptospirillia bacterium]
MRIFMIGDIVGEPGRKAVFKHLDRLREEHGFDLVIANAENAAGGFGVTHNVVRELFGMGIDVLTTGNHVWDKREAMDIIRTEKRLLRPANYPPGTPGLGSGVFTTAAGERVGVLQVMGRVFMHALDCPFRIADQEVTKLARETDCIVVDMHCEATSEKQAMGWHLDGRVAAVVGTHTHVQTADARVLPEGTGYITDLGMTGPLNGIIGMKRDLVLSRFLTGMPRRFAVAQGPVVLSGAIADIDTDTGRCNAMRNIYLPDE